MMIYKIDAQFVICLQNFLFSEVYLEQPIRYVGCLRNYSTIQSIVAGQY